MSSPHAAVALVGMGIVGIATAYYLAKSRGLRGIRNASLAPPVDAGAGLL